MTKITPFQVTGSANIKHGELAGSTSALQLPDVPVGTYALLKAQSTNVGSVFIGSSSSTTVAGGTTDVTTGYELTAGQEMPVYVNNLNLLYRICNNAGDDLTYIIF